MVIPPDTRESSESDKSTRTLMGRAGSLVPGDTSSSLFLSRLMAVLRFGLDQALSERVFPKIVELAGLILGYLVERPAEVLPQARRGPRDLACVCLIR
jgi:hypothetical protein